MSTSTVNYSDLYPWIMPEVPNCPAPMVDQEIFNALRDFCRDTHAWNEILEPLTIRSGKTLYPIDNPFEEYGSVWSVMYIERNRRRLRPVVDYVADKCEVTLRCTPSADDPKALVIRVAFDPVFGQTIISRCLFNDWGNKIAVSVKSRLMLMQGKTWTNEKMGAVYRTDAYNDFANAKIKVMNEMSNNKESMVRPMHRFA